MTKSTYAASANEPQACKRYPSDCTDDEWVLIEPYTHKRALSGRKRDVNMREIINALFYRTRTGCQWRMLPKDFPLWQHVWYYYDLWTKDGTWEQMNDALRKRVRQSVGKDPEPTLGIIDTKTVPATEAGGERGYDGAKHLNGRKRHILVDTLGLLLVLVVHTASLQDYEAAEDLFIIAQRKLPRLQKVMADSIYSYLGLVERVKATFRFVLEIVKRDRKRVGFYVLPKRWIVERSFAWFGRSRILSKEYETLVESSETDIYIASIRMMLTRLNRVKH